MNILEEIQTVQRQAERLYSEADVEKAIDLIAREISVYLSERNPIVLTVLNGGIPFAGKLIMRLSFPMQIDSIRASRYHGQTSGSHTQWLVKPTLPLQGRTVLIIDDVLDEGVTLAEIIAWCKEQGAEEVYSAVLVDKQIGRERPCSANFVALQTENRYLFGYGMDYKNYLRNAPGIFACKDL